MKLYIMDTCGITNELHSALQSLQDEDESQELSILDEIHRYLRTPEFQKITLGAIKKRRKTNKRADYWDSEWGKLLNDSRVYNLKSKAALRFKRRFRVNIYMFDKIVHLCTFHNIFQDGPIPHGNSIDTEFKVLICLRKLGRYEVDDTSSELSHIGKLSYIHHYVIFAHTICNNVTKTITTTNYRRIDNPRIV